MCFTWVDDPNGLFEGGCTVFERDCENYLYVPAPGANAPRTKRFHGVLASSADGLVFHRDHVVNVSWPPPQKWDTHNNVFFDERTQSYVVTTRNIPVESTGVERETSLTRSVGPKYDFDFSKAPPVIMRGNISHQTYAQITFPWLDVYLGLVMVFDSDTGDQVHCRLTFAPTPEGPWQPVEGDNIVDAPDFLPLGGPGAFDSHIIFAGASPFRHDSGAEWMYYMGGNGPHDGARNSSFALATLRPDGYASVRGAGVFRTPLLVVTSEMITATVDFGGAGGALRIGVLPDEPGEPPVAFNLDHSVPLTANATDAQMHFAGGCGGPDLKYYVGKKVVLEVSLEGDALLYAVGFAPRAAEATCES